MNNMTTYEQQFRMLNTILNCQDFTNMMPVCRSVFESIPNIFHMLDFFPKQTEIVNGIENALKIYHSHCCLNRVKMYLP